ncbi:MULTISPECIES: ketopantoate reductase family protein [unclassified Xanthobacter]|uniref:ketopantoate reductase family protein n=1 Tax=unclassified Xanthobacter TaxID=2623496 RepID=UPI001EDDA150|nr:MULTISPECIES: 2-dehydropantoate 2-reductase [unclassified Xanthobacter]
MSTPAALQAAPARICVAGAGAIGIVIAARLALAGHDVTVLARGGTLAAIRAHGLELTDRTGVHRVAVRAVDHLTGPQVGPQDVVFLSSKAQDLAPLATLVQPAIGRDTLIVPTVNGIPWWYFEGHGGPDDGRAVEAVDPGGALKRLLPAAQLVGAVTYITSERTAPHAARTHNPLRMVVGTVTPAAHTGTARIAAVLEAAGITTERTDDIRAAVWAKAINNLCTNPLSVVTGATLREIFGDPTLAGVAQATADEARAVAAAYGATVTLDPGEIVKLGDVRTSMLQDYESGRPLELAAIGDAVLELARHKGLCMVRTGDILALARFKMRKARAAPPPK